jgi:hypothetical protein
MGKQKLLWTTAEIGVDVQAIGRLLLANTLLAETSACLGQFVLKPRNS